MNRSELTESTMEASIASVASKVTYTSAGSIGFGWLLSSEAAVFFGIIGVVAGNLINYWFKRKDDKRKEKADKREEELHKLKLQEFHASRSPH